MSAGTGLGRAAPGLQRASSPTPTPPIAVQGLLGGKGEVPAAMAVLGVEENPTTRRRLRPRSLQGSCPVSRLPAVAGATSPILPVDLLMCIRPWVSPLPLGDLPFLATSVITDHGPLAAEPVWLLLPFSSLCTCNLLRFK